MRIAFDSQIFAVQTYGGISRYFTRLAQGLLDLDQQVGVFAPLYQNAYLEELPKEIVHGAYISRYPARTARLFLAYNSFKSNRQMARWRPDLVHETYYSMSPSSPVRCPVVVTVLDMIHDLFPDSFADSEKMIATKRKAVERADHVICISENTKNDLMRLYKVPASKISVVYLGFDLFRRSSDSGFVNPSGKPYILYVGSRGGYKNFLGILEAVSSSDNLQSNFDIVAFGGGPFTADETRKISGLGFSSEQVVHQGGDDRMLGSLYSSASAFVYPSLYEGFGIPPLEAMAHQCPVVCSNTGPMPEVVGDAAELFDPMDTEDIRHAIEKILFSEEKSQQLIARGNERINQFSWGQCAQETLAIYERLT